jgi:rRNA maturation endonuclease Nob1
MIRVSLTVLIFIYLALFLMAIFALWIGFEWRRQRRERQAARHRIRCTLCAFAFEDPSAEPLPRCPRCGSLNEREPFRIL